MYMYYYAPCRRGIHATFTLFTNAHWASTCEPIIEAYTRA